MKWLPKGEEFAWMTLRFAHSRADLTLCTSPQMKEELVAHGIPRVDVWRMGIDTVRFDPKFKNLEMRKKMTDGNPDASDNASSSCCRVSVACHKNRNHRSVDSQEINHLFTHTHTTVGQCISMYVDENHEKESRRNFTMKSDP